MYPVRRTGRKQQFLGHVRLETTTIYAKVAVLNKRQIESPLDKATGRSNTTSAEVKKPKTVGRLRIDVQQRSDTDEAVSTATICNRPKDVVLYGIKVRQPRPGWVTLDIPPLEQWESSLKKLTHAQRERIESPEFYELLQRQIGQRYLAMKPPG